MKYTKTCNATAWIESKSMVPIYDKTAVLGSVEAHLRSIRWQSKLTCLGLLVCAGIGTKETRGKRFFLLSIGVAWTDI